MMERLRKKLRRLKQRVIDIDDWAAWAEEQVTILRDRVDDYGERTCAVETAQNRFDKRITENAAALSNLRYELGSRLKDLEDGGAIAKLKAALEDATRGSERMRKAVDLVESMGANIRSLNARVDEIQGRSGPTNADLSRRVVELEKRLEHATPKIPYVHPQAGGGTTNQGGTFG